MTSEKSNTPTRQSLFLYKILVGSFIFINQWLLAEFTSEVNTSPTNLNNIVDAQNVDDVAKAISQDY